jgi:hypothetical protein
MTWMFFKPPQVSVGREVRRRAPRCARMRQLSPVESRMDETQGLRIGIAPSGDPSDMPLQESGDVAAREIGYVAHRAANA